MSATLQRLQTALAPTYRIERELGAGGMATVYLAHDLTHDRPVAIKLLSEEPGAARRRAFPQGRHCRDSRMCCTFTTQTLFGSCRCKQLVSG